MVSQNISQAARLVLSFATSVILMSLFLIPVGDLRAETFYKYLDQKGTVVFTQNLADVPEALRDGVEELKLRGKKSVDEAQKVGENATQLGRGLKNKLGDAKDALGKMANKEALQDAGEAGLRQGKELFSSFVKDKKSMLISYAVAGIAGFFVVSMLLKRFVGSFIATIFMKLAMVVALFCGVYLFYLSWLNKSVLNFDQVADGAEKGVLDQITTPQEMLQKTKDVVSQFNESAAKRNEAINNLDEQ